MNFFIKKMNIILFYSIILLSIKSTDTICFSDTHQVIVEDFERYTTNPFDNWLLRNATKEKARQIYSIQSENNNKFLQAHAVRSSIQIIKKVKWKLKIHPVLTWRWRITELPDHANEEARGKNDSAAAIYVVFQRKKIPFVSWRYQPINVIKYVWSTTLPKGKVVNKKKVKLGSTIYEGRFLVLESGKKHKGDWITESQNVLNDYKRLFGKLPKYDPILIAILTDSNDTKSTATADYDDIVICK